MSSIHNITLSNEKLSCLTPERNMHRSTTDLKRKPSKTFLNKYFGKFLNVRTTGDGLFHWRKRYYEYFVQKWPFKVKTS